MSATGGISSASSFWTRSLGSSAASAAGQGKAASGSQAAASSNTATQSGNSNAPAGSGTAADGSKLTDAQRQQVDKLKSVDRSVRAHEAAHKAAGGPYAGSATYTFSTGPDGQHYATAGEVSIDTSVVQGDPRATISKLETVRRAALAPADPSGQDRAVAAQAAAGIAAAQAQEAKQTNAKDDGATDGKGAVGMRPTRPHLKAPRRGMAQLVPGASPIGRVRQPIARPRGPRTPASCRQHKRRRNRWPWSFDGTGRRQHLRGDSRGDNSRRRLFPGA